MVYPQGRITTPYGGGGGASGESLDGQVRAGAAGSYMPLDSSSGSETYRSPGWDDDFQPISLSDFAALSEGLRAAREATGRSLDDLADTTRVRRQYLEALEAGEYDKLPSRPFSTGYVRAYARALGLDEETAAERFKAEAPDSAATLRAPIGGANDFVDVRRTEPRAGMAIRRPTDGLTHIGLHVQVDGLVFLVCHAGIVHSGGFVERADPVQCDRTTRAFWPRCRRTVVPRQGPHPGMARVAVQILERLAPR